MLYLFYTIIYTVALFIIFRAFPIYRINTFQAIVINYVVCVITGILFLESPASLFDQDLTKPWALYSFLIGSFFVFSFSIIAYTVQKINVTVATIANKMSLVVPTVFSLLILKTGIANFTFISLAGLILGIIAILLTSIRAPQNTSHPAINKFYSYLMPLLVFASGGLIDLMTTYVSHKHMSADNREYFALLCYLAAAIVGVLILSFKILFQGEKLEPKNIVAGLILGVPNYFSFYYLIKTLDSYHNNGAFVFPVINIIVIVMTSFLAVLFFKEKLSFKNLLGIFLAIVSILLIFIDGN